MSKIALHNHNHTCPQTGHTGGKIFVTDNSRPTINGVPIALVGDKCFCQDGTQLSDTIITGSSSLTVNGVPVAITGSKTAHGGIVIEGDSNLTIDE
ncbi:PAAR domain-containing protein [Pasteurella atlantica]|uniref:PAAR domain-containing protein n=2 Tax=Pasteurellaceae TaxID=712 RepID=A0ACC6HQ19_9PAST|nr:PAAR domain-containing protein [Pasteurella atlantica]MDP8052811.1 PAAR domain-containing protein [Pasteurella atlantica]MDP8105754.1 PAAR domain-containing protein [Pasteurella atlantica]MDP8149498.1 PAAR domain-containing protein [Pasteurella atlantica]